ncbi:Polyadenylate-binding protein-interacting protein 3 [Mucuna pruriens]|uniref:Polyadenylate-binding protein-interacting protein 3 n=1 Tax=Mucuna pruriens TaxID=157652 RepID=A0A371EQ20_MUCPR|nr:Polyadenylate-binding protein-interacting protein 3 [Mucuna pruriens]
MGCRNMDSFTEDHTCSSSSSSSSLSEALLFTTMCIVGLPVDVHVKDGSVYSGIFHTASVHTDYGIVLKKARMTKKGKGSTNVGIEVVVDTLVILSGDLVQVVAKGVMLPADGVGGNITGDDEEAVVNNVCSESLTCEVENHIGPLMDAEQVNQSRQAGDDKSNLKGKADDHGQKSELINEKIDEKIQSLNSSHETDTCLGQEVAVEYGSADRTSSPSDNGLFCNNAPASVKADDRHSERSTSAESISTNSTQGVDHITESQLARSVEISAPRVTDSSRNAKEFKLNPAAKTFSPSFVNPMPATSAANMVYIPNSSPVIPVANIQPEVGFNTFASRPSVPVKVAQYSNLTVGNGGSGSQFSQPIVGQLTHRTQPLRYATHYTPVLSEPAYLQPSSPAVMVGRSPQLVYVQPVSHDLIHGATTVAPVSARPLLNHVQFPKQQGAIGQAMPVCVPPPVLTSGQQPFALQSHIPLLHPGFPVTRPISVPGPNGFYGTKRV